MTTARYAYAVYLDGVLLDTIPGRKKDAQKWVRAHITSTHMGEWRRVNKIDLHYCTTIGRTYTFMRIGGLTR